MTTSLVAPLPVVDPDAASLEPSFADLGIPAALCDVLARQGIDRPFPIQTATIKDSLAGRDVLGRGRTGSGKTLAFVLPVLTRLSRSKSERRSRAPRAMILAPTRELALQILAALEPLAEPLGLRSMAIFGGVSYNPQITKLRAGVDVVVACPGRLEDLLEQRALVLDAVEIVVLDEADHMADLGFLPPVKRLLSKTPSSGQRMLFSATLDNGIDVLVRNHLHNPVTHSVDSEQSPVAKMTHHVLHVSTKDRLEILVDLTSAPGKTIVFTRTKHRAKSLTKQLNDAGVSAVEMHGNLSQAARVRNLAAFTDGRAVTMVATDIAARGIHVDDVTLVIHSDPPTEHKAYLHRSGRTARAGNEGTVATLATETERREVSHLTRKAGIKPTVTEVRPGHPVLVELAPGDRVRKTAEEMAAFQRSFIDSRPAQGGGGGGGQRRHAPRSGPKAPQGSSRGRSGSSAGGASSQRSGGRPAQSSGSNRQSRSSSRPR